MATKRKSPRSGGGRSNSRGAGNHGRALLMTGGLGAAAVAGFLALGYFSEGEKPRPTPGATQKPRLSASAAAPAPAPGPRYGADDRDRLSRLAALPGAGSTAGPADGGRRPPAPIAVAAVPPARPSAPEVFAPPADIPPPERPGARRMSAAEWRTLDTALSDQLRRCWPQAEARGGGYVPVIKVEFDATGALARKPELIGARNPQEIAAGEALARAVARCGPMPVPPDLRAFHAQWKVRTIRLDPPQMSGL